MIDPAVRQAWSAIGDAPVVVLTGGLINATYLVKSEPPLVLQRLHKTFDARVCDDIAALTKHLSSAGLTTPVIIPTDAGDNALDHDGIWRVLSFVPGHTHHKVTTDRLAFSSGKLTGLFHRALASFAYDYTFTRPGVHDTERHLGILRAALDAHKGHRLYDDVSKAAISVLRPPLTDFSACRPHHAHGDLKISNLLFDADDVGICLLDLDTIGCMIWPFEMGDAIRSWCNPRTEDERGAIDIDIFRAALLGYAESGMRVSVPDRALLVAGVENICRELSARFLADALSENYFGFDAAKYPGRGEHNLARGLGQLSLYQSVVSERRALEAIVDANL